VTDNRQQIKEAHMPELGKLFDSGTNQIKAVLDTVEDLTAQVGEGTFPDKPLALTLDAPNPSLSLFNTPVTLGAIASVNAQILAKETKFRPFDDDVDVIAPDGMSYARLALDGKLNAGATPSGNVGSLQISGNAAATAELSYLHLRPVRKTQSRFAALTDLALTTQLPQLANLKKLTAGEVLRFDAMFNLDLGIKAKYGAALDIEDTVDVVSDLSFPVKAHAQFTVDAALGFGLYEQMSVIVARAGQRNPANWVRIRFTRTRRNRITFGAAFTLAVQYDATKGADMLLDKTFAQLQMPKVVTDLRALTVQAQKPWSQIKTELTAKAADAVTTLVGNTGWQQWLDESDEVKNFLKGTNWIVDSYDKLEEKVKSVWEELLARLDDAGFAKIKARIDQVAAINVDQIDIKALTSGQLDQVIELIELFSGKNIEELVLTGEVKAGLQKAIDFAKKLQKTIADASENKALELLQTYAQRTGVKSLVTWLRANATSAAQLKKAANTWIESTVERLTGKALALIDEKDVEKVQKFAAKLQKLIDAPQELEAKLRKAVTKLKGEFTVSLSVEISRVSEYSAVADVELDPSNDKALDAASLLSSGNVAQMLKALNGADEKAFDIREVVLTSRHIRTSISTLFFSFAGSIVNDKGQVRESTVRVDGSGGEKRTGLYTGGVTVRRKADGVNSEGAAWLRIETASSNPDVEAPYDSLDASFRLTYVREDVKSTKTELDSLDTILEDLGFFATGDKLNRPAGVVATRFALELSLPAPAVTALVADVNDDQKFAIDMRNAGIRWFADTGVANAADAETGRNLVHVLRSQRFGETWIQRGQPFRTAILNGEFGVDIRDQDSLAQRYIAVQLFADSRPLWQSRYKDFDPLEGAQTPAALEAMTKQGMMMFSTANIDWQVPLFNFWLVLSRLSRSSPELLAKATGVATFRTRANEQEPWGTPQWLTLPAGSGIIAQALRDRCFTL
jgi:hypothetical protein